MPREWNEASLENVIIANNEISVFYTKTEGTMRIEVYQSKPDWIIELQVPYTDQKSYQLVEGDAALSKNKSLAVYTGTGPKMIFEISNK